MYKDFFYKYSESERDIYQGNQISEIEDLHTFGNWSSTKLDPGKIYSYHIYLANVTVI